MAHPVEEQQVRSRVREALPHPAVQLEAPGRLPAVHADRAPVELLGHEQVAGVAVVDLGQEADVRRMRLVERLQLLHRRHRERVGVEDVLAVGGAGVPVRGHAALAAQFRVGEEEGDRAVGEPVRAGEALMVVAALAPEDARAHALDGVEVAAGAPARVARHARQLGVDVPGGRVRSRVAAAGSVGSGALRRRHENRISPSPGARPTRRRVRRRLDGAHTAAPTLGWMFLTPHSAARWAERHGTRCSALPKQRCLDSPIRSGGASPTIGLVIRMSPTASAADNVSL